MNTREVHGGQRLAVDFRIGDQYALRYQRLVLLFEIDINLWTDEGCNGFLISLGTDNKHLVSNVEYRLAVRDGQFSIVNDARYYKVTIQEIVDL